MNNAGLGVLDLAGVTLGAGVYKYDAVLLNGVLTLDFAGVENQNIVFQIAQTLTTASGPGIASVVIKNAAAGDNVYWVVGSSAQIGTYTSFAGDIIAYATVAMQTGATDACGTVISLTAAVTLDTNTISTTCPILDSSGTTVGTFGTGGTGTPTTTIAGGVSGTVASHVPEGGSTLLYLAFFLLPIGAMQAFRGRRSV
jgi:hypothetical protein